MFFHEFLISKTSMNTNDDAAQHKKAVLIICLILS